MFLVLFLSICHFNFTFRILIIFAVFLQIHLYFINNALRQHCGAVGSIVGSIEPQSYKVTNSNLSLVYCLCAVFCIMYKYVLVGGLAILNCP